MNQIKQYILTFLSIGYLLQVNAQINTGTNQYLFNPAGINPAIAGLMNNQLQLGYEARWVGIQGAPQTLFLAYDKVFSENTGWNTAIYSDHAGPVSSYAISNAFAYHLNLSRTVNLSMGMKHVLSQSYLSLGNQKVIDNDDLLLSSNLNGIPVNNFDAGLAVYKPDHFLIGMSCSNLIPQKRYRFIQATEQPVLSMQAWYNTEVNNHLSVEASALASTSTNIPLTLQFSGMLVLDRTLGVGINFSPSNQIGALVYVKTKERLNLFYNYNMPATQIFAVTKQSHAIGLSYRFGKDPAASKTFFIQSYGLVKKSSKTTLTNTSPTTTTPQNPKTEKVQPKSK
jgi:type IX secretion system PorP/SprF family membrane protein